MPKRPRDEDFRQMGDIEGGVEGHSTKRFKHQSKKGKSGTRDSEQKERESINRIKTRIRDVERLLKKKLDVLPANVRVDRERELVALRHDLAVAEARKKRSAMISKYHKVRFFERQKATRQLKKITKQLNENDDPSKTEELQRQRHIAEVDLNYTIYYPLVRTYVSLYPKKKEEEDGKTSADSEEARSGPRGDIEMWKTVEKAMEEGTLEALRNSMPVELSRKEDNPAAQNEGRNGKARRKADDTAAIEDVVMEKSDARKRDRRENPSSGKERSSRGADTSSKQQEVEAEDDEGDASDGGFFEEA